jgi:thiamine biosynthesis lipoprotein ApbE
VRRIIAIALLIVVVTAGCTAPTGQQPSVETTAIESAETTAIEPVETTTADSAETTRTAIETTRRTTTDSEPEKGDQFLSVSELNESQAAEWNASKRAAFGNLSEERQQVVKRAIECDCNVELHGEFSFYDEDRIEVLSYDSRFYFLRVVIV